MKKSKDKLDDSFVELVQIICSRLADGKRVRRKLPGGRIHIDRPLPFLCIYRLPAHRKDKGTKRLVMGEASYVVATGEKSFEKSLDYLINRVTETLSESFGSFLIVEVWSSQKKITRLKQKKGVPKPAFHIFTDKPQYSELTPIFSEFELSLKNIQIHKIKPKVEVSFDKKVTPPGLSPLLNHSKPDAINVTHIGLEVSPIYRGGGKKEIYPLILQALNRGISRSLKRVFFEFVQTQTDHKPANYQELGRHAVVKAVWEIDRRLAEISNAFDLLFLITPVNADDVWKEFKANRFKKIPEFFYRPLPVDPALFKRKLFNIPIERVEDPSLAHIFREKQAEIAHTLDMLIDRGSRKFLYGNLQLYGDVDDKLVKLAKKILHQLPARRRRQIRVEAATFRKKANLEITSYRKIYPKFKAKTEIRSDIPGILVVKGNLFIGKNVKVARARLNGLIQHEVGTHMVSYYNGLTQPLKLLSVGLAGYEELQEGLAIMAEYLAGELTVPRLRTIAARVVAAKHLTECKSFMDTFNLLVETYKFEPYKAFRVTMRIYRGGGSIKDIIYLRGLVKVINYLKNGGTLHSIYAGKFGISHIPIIQELIDRDILKSSSIRPHYLDFPQTAKRLQYLRSAPAVYELAERSSN